MQGIRRNLLALSMLLAVVAAWNGVNSSSAQVKRKRPEPRIITGSLVSFSPRGVVVKTDKGNVGIPCNARTSWRVYARASQEVLKPGSVVQAAGRFDWNSFYLMTDAGVTLYVSNRPTSNGARITEDGRLVVTGQVIKTNPLVIRADRSCPPVLVRRVGNRAVGRAPVRGRNFQIGRRPGATISVYFGKNLKAARKESDVRVTINVPGPRVAASVSLTRKEIIKPGEFASSKKKRKKKSSKKKKDDKKKTEKKDDEKKDSDKKDEKKKDAEKDEKKNKDSKKKE